MAEAPRALSCDPDDRRYSPDWRAFVPLRVFLDGVEQQNVLAYDVDEGLVVVHATNWAGELIPNEARDEIVRYTRRGVVTVELL